MSQRQNKYRAQQLVGAVVVAVGILLLVGNVTGAFRTFPFAGFLTMVGGKIIMAKGSSPTPTVLESQPALSPSESNGGSVQTGDKERHVLKS